MSDEKTQSTTRLDEAAEKYAESRDNESGSFLSHQLKAIRVTSFIAGHTLGKDEGRREAENEIAGLTKALLIAETMIELNEVSLKDFGFFSDTLTRLKGRA